MQTGNPWLFFYCGVITVQVFPPSLVDKSWQVFVDTQPWLLFIKLSCHPPPK
jgi:hypothetical protein